MMNPSKTIFRFFIGIFIYSLEWIIRYSTFARIGTGLSYADYVWVRDKPWKAWNAQQQPSFLLTANRSQEDKGDVFLEPEASVAVDFEQVNTDEIVCEKFVSTQG